MKNSDITILIPAHNKHDYLKYLLEYYKDYQIVILDSTIDKYSYKLSSNVKYVHQPGIDWFEKISTYPKYIDTEFVCLTADDDFTLKNVIPRFVDYLKKNKEYSIVQGQFAVYDKSYTPIRIYSKYTEKYIKNLNQNFFNTIKERLSYNFNNYIMSVYGVMRSKALFEVSYLFERLLKNNIDSKYIGLADRIFEIGLLSFGSKATLTELFNIREKYNANRDKRYLFPNIVNSKEPEFINVFDTFIKEIMVIESYKKENISKEFLVNLFRNYISNINLNKSNFKKVNLMISTLFNFKNLFVKKMELQNCNLYYQDQHIKLSKVNYKNLPLYNEIYKEDIEEISKLIVENS